MNNTNDVYNPEAFAARVNYAAQCLVRGTRSRRFDTCFEMADGDAVVVALVIRCQKNPKLKAACAKGWPDLVDGLPAHWIKLAQHHCGKNLEQLAADMRARFAKRYQTAVA